MSLGKYVAGKSAPRHLSPEERVKIAKAAIYSLASCILAGLIAVLAIPFEQLPAQLLPYLPLVPVINAFLYGINIWLRDNR